MNSDHEIQLNLDHSVFDKISLPKPINSPLVKLHKEFGISNLEVKDETYNPTHTFKDRLSWELLAPLVKNINAGSLVEPTTIGCLSYGNTALSLGHYCAQLNSQAGKTVVNVIVFIPTWLKSRQLGPDTEGRYISGSEIIRMLKKNCELIELDFSKRPFYSSELERIARESGRCLDKFIDVTEGLNRPAYDRILAEVVEHQTGRPPDYVIVPFGAGVLCNELMDYVLDNNLQTKIIPVSTGNPASIASMLYGPIWLDVNSLRVNGFGMTKHRNPDEKGRQRNPYKVYHVDDTEILSALGTLSRIGISAEPSGAAGFAILPRLKSIDPSFDPKSNSVLVINTGNGLCNFSRNLKEDKVNLESIDAAYISKLILDKLECKYSEQNEQNLFFAKTLELSNVLRELEVLDNIWELKLSNLEHSFGRKDINEAIRLWSVPRKTAEVLESLVILTGAKNILEIGTSGGYSTLHLASGAKFNKGKVFTIELLKDKVELAKSNIIKARLDNITILEGEASAVLKGLHAKKFDFVFLDADKENYGKYLDILLPLLKMESLIIADNVNDYGHLMEDYLQRVAGSHYPHSRTEKSLISHYIACLDNGIIVSRKISD